MEQNSESSIIQRARRGDQEAINRLYEETKNYAYFVARRYMQNDEDIADILQDAYISAFSKLNTFEDSRSFKPWLHTIVTNKCLNFIKSKRAIFVSENDIGEIASDNEEIIPAAWLERAEKRRDIMRIIDGLPDGQRMAVTLFYFEGLSIAEMSEAMGIAEGTVKAHLYHGRKAIKEAVLLEEKKGNKLYAIVPLPLLSQLFELEAEAAVMPEAMSKTIWEGTINALAANGVIAGANATAAGTAVKGGGVAAKFVALSTGAKAGIISAAVAVVLAAVGIPVYLSRQVALQEPPVAQITEADVIETEAPPAVKEHETETPAVIEGDGMPGSSITKLNSLESMSEDEYDELMYELSRSYRFGEAPPYTVENILQTYLLDSPAYYYIRFYIDYFGEDGVEIVIDGSADPINRLSNDYNMGYMIFNGENVDWLLLNVFNITPDYSLKSDYIYYHEGNYYAAYNESGWPETDLAITHFSHIEADDYYVTVDYTWGDTLYFHMRRKAMGDSGKEFWSYVNISNSPIF